jgi:hypothetical protein
MSTTDVRSTRQLFKDWRTGEEQAGQLMAQRVADWYYAIATSRLGERRGHQPCQRACAGFGSGIVNVTESRALVQWAHDLIVREVREAGSRAVDGDSPSNFTGKQRPKPLLRKCREALPEDMALLEQVYGHDAQGTTIDEVRQNPLQTLEARYRVKMWLRDQMGIPFEVAPEKPNLDRGPLPLYESNRMVNPEEERQFEHWMLTDLNLCKDIAEFAHFSIALRGGIPDEVEHPAPVESTQRAPATHPARAPMTGRGNLTTMAIVAGVTIVLMAGIAAIGGLIAFFTMG